MAGLVIECKDIKDWETHFESRENSEELVVVVFVANWVKNCAPFIPIVEDVARDYPDITFLKVDADKLKIKAEDEYKLVGELPAVIFFKEGEEVERIEGAKNDEQLRQAIERHSN